MFRRLWGTLKRGRKRSFDKGNGQRGATDNAHEHVCDSERVADQQDTMDPSDRAHQQVQEGMAELMRYFIDSEQRERADAYRRGHRDPFIDDFMKYGAANAAQTASNNRGASGFPWNTRANEPVTCHVTRDTELVSDSWADKLATHEDDEITRWHTAGDYDPEDPFFWTHIWRAQMSANNVGESSRRRGPPRDRLSREIAAYEDERCRIDLPRLSNLALRGPRVPAPPRIPLVDRRLDMMLYGGIEDHDYRSIPLSTEPQHAHGRSSMRSGRWGSQTIDCADADVSASRSSDEPSSAGMRADYVPRDVPVNISAEMPADEARTATGTSRNLASAPQQHTQHAANTRPGSPESNPPGGGNRAPARQPIFNAGHEVLPRFVPNIVIHLPPGVNGLSCPVLYDANAGTAWPIDDQRIFPSGQVMYTIGSPFAVDYEDLDEEYTGIFAEAYVHALEFADADLRKRMSRLGIADIGLGMTERGYLRIGCAICMEAYPVGELCPRNGSPFSDSDVVVVPCAGQHTLHAECLRSWLASVEPDKWSCPLCRVPLSSGFEGVKPQPSMRDTVYLYERLRHWRCDAVCCEPTVKRPADDALVRMLPCNHEVHLSCMREHQNGTRENEEPTTDADMVSPAALASGQIVDKWVNCAACGSRACAWMPAPPRTVHDG